MWEGVGYAAQGLQDCPGDKDDVPLDHVHHRLGLYHLLGLIVFPSDLQELVLLECFSGDIERKIIGVNNTLDKAEIAGHHVLEVVSDEDPSDVQLDILSCLFVLVGLFRRLWEQRGGT